MRKLLGTRLVPSHLSNPVRIAIIVVVVLIATCSLIAAYVLNTLTVGKLAANVRAIPFPIGVDPEAKTITEEPALEDFVLFQGQQPEAESWVTDNFIARYLFDLAQATVLSVALPNSKLIVIYPGERKEEIAQNIGKLFGWNRAERDDLQARVMDAVPNLNDGAFYPGKYLVPRRSRPPIVSQSIIDKFKQEILTRYEQIENPVVPLKDALIIASLLEREAYGFNTDMRQISGIIWNRLFTGMRLQLDATLQYARGSRSYEPEWWPVPRPADKNIVSPYNTYTHSGLPPEPISNPSRDAVLAALNPVETGCLFYFHASRTKFYCSATYEEHVAKLKEVYGRGK